MKNIAKKYELSILAAVAIVSLAVINFTPTSSDANNRPEKNPVISNVRAMYVTPTTAIVTWVTDVPTTGVVYFGLKRNETTSGVGGSNEPVRGHAAVLTNLSANTKYFYHVSIADNGKGRDRTNVDTFTTLPPAPRDITPPNPPLVSAVGDSESTIRISWSGASDPSGIASYTVFRDGSGTASLNGVTQDWNDAVSPGSSHTYYLRVTDALGNYVDTAAFNATTLGGVVDPVVQ